VVEFDPLATFLCERVRRDKELHTTNHGFGNGISRKAQAEVKPPTRTKSRLTRHFFYRMGDVVENAIGRHSPTQLAKAAITNQTGHRSSALMRRYIREGSLCSPRTQPLAWACNPSDPPKMPKGYATLVSRDDREN